MTEILTGTSSCRIVRIAGIVSAKNQQQDIQSRKDFLKQVKMLKE
jgi:hypothetical protein